LPSPASSYEPSSYEPSYEQSYTSAEYCPPQYYSEPMSTSMTTAMCYAPMMPTMAMPSSLIAQCGPSLGYGGFGGFDWDRCNDFSIQYATTM